MDKFENNRSNESQPERRPRRRPKLDPQEVLAKLAMPRTPMQQKWKERNENQWSMYSKIIDLMFTKPELSLRTDVLPHVGSERPVSDVLALEEAFEVSHFAVVLDNAAGVPAMVAMPVDVFLAVMRPLLNGRSAATIEQAGDEHLPPPGHGDAGRGQIFGL